MIVLLTVAEAARRVERDRSRIWQLIREGRLPANEDERGRHLVVREEDLLRVFSTMKRGRPFASRSVAMNLQALLDAIENESVYQAHLDQVRTWGGRTYTRAEWVAMFWMSQDRFVADHSVRLRTAQPFQVGESLPDPPGGPSTRRGS